MKIHLFWFKFHLNVFQKGDKPGLVQLMTWHWIGGELLCSNVGQDPWYNKASQGCNELKICAPFNIHIGVVYFVSMA